MDWNVKKWLEERRIKRPTSLPREVSWHLATWRHYAFQELKPDWARPGFYARPCYFKIRHRLKKNAYLLAQGYLEETVYHLDTNLVEVRLSDKGLKALGLQRESLGPPLRLHSEYYGYKKPVDPPVAAKAERLPKPKFQKPRGYSRRPRCGSRFETD